MHICLPNMGLKLVFGRMADQGEVKPGAGGVLHADPLTVRHPAVKAPAYLFGGTKCGKKFQCMQIKLLAYGDRRWCH